MTAGIFNSGIIANEAEGKYTRAAEKNMAMSISNNSNGNYSTSVMKKDSVVDNQYIVLLNIKAPDSQSIDGNENKTRKLWPRNQREKEQT